jgi:hypothetical protein
MTMMSSPLGKIMSLACSRPVQNMVRILLATLVGAHEHDSFTLASLYVQAHADALQMRVVTPEATECMLLGGAIMGAASCGMQGSVQEAMVR